jgi:hypothetical protein
MRPAFALSGRRRRPSEAGPGRAYRRRPPFLSAMLGSPGRFCAGMGSALGADGSNFSFPREGMTAKSLPRELSVANASS